MRRRRRLGQPLPRTSACCIALAIACLLSPFATNRALADQLKENTSLRFTPADTSFYSSMLRGGEQWERFSDSLAFSRLKQLFVVQTGIALAKNAIETNEEIEGELDQAKSIWGELKEMGLLDLMNDGWRNEIFLHSDSAMSDWLRLFVDMNTEMQRVQLQMLGNLGSDELEENIERGTAELINQTAIDAKSLPLPRFTLGMRLTDNNPAIQNIARLEEWLTEKISETPGVTIQRTDLDGNAFLELVVKFADLPWEEWVRDEDSNNGQKAIKTMRSAMQEKQLHVGLGVENDFLILSAGPDLKSQKRLAGDKLLIDIEEMKRVRSVDDQRVTGVAYVSHKFMQAAQRPGQTLDDTTSTLQQLIMQSDWAETQPEMAQDVNKDLRELSEDLKRWMPEQSTMVSVEWMTDDGYESYLQNWSENLTLDGSRKLDILKQAGEDPIMLSASCSKTKGEGYRMLSKWSGRGQDWFTRLMEAYGDEVDEEQQEVLDSILPMAANFMNRFDEITNQALLPSMGNQSLVVLDDKLTSRRWIPMLPESTEQLKLPQLSFAYRLTNGKQFDEAVDGYAEWGTDLLQTVKDTFASELAKAEQQLKDADEDERDEAETTRDELQAALDNFDTLMLPDVEEAEFKNGKLYKLAISEIGVDKQFAPTMAMTDKTVVLSTSPETAQRLAGENAAPRDGLIGENAGKPLAAAYLMQPKRLTELLRSWTDYGFKTAVDMTEQKELNMFRGQVDSILRIIGCCQRVETVTFVEGNSLVTHRRSSFKDLER